ncbi:MAG: DNA polymerase III subunit alpha, partial [Candidatus Uhrbacteria bacterium]
MPNGKDFVHLHVHSHYSLLGALPKVGQLLDHVQQQGGEAMALTDNGAMYGIIEFYKKAKKAEIKPIIGMDAYIAPHGRLEKRGKVDAKSFRLVLLAENNQGYKNLIKLSSLGFLEGFYYHPRIDKELLKKYSEGLIALTGGTYGEIPATIRDYGKEKAVEALKEYVDIFSPNNFFLELVDRPEVPEQESVNATLIEIGKEMNLPIVACKNSHYLHPEDNQAWKVLQCVRGGKTLEDYERMNQFDYDASLVAPETMIERFKDVPEAIENTKKIANRCNVEIEIGVWHFPPVDIPEGHDADTLLRKQTYDLASKKYDIPLSDEVKERIDYELDIIKLKEYSGYFLSVADYTKWARDNAVVTTTRGSAAGSIVSYIIGISSIDPLVYQLPFERFLNPERPSAPDVDADFADNQRDRVLKYVTEKYGQDRVAQICTFGTMLARGSIRDVGRALGHPYAFVDQISKQVPMGQQGMPMTLKRALNENLELKRMYDNDGRIKQIIDTAMQIEGCARHVSVHAAGVVIAPTALTDFTPLQIDTREGKIITQYEMHAVEDAGLVKMDFLGIRNLSILGDAIKIVSKTKGVDVDIENIPVDDKKTFELLAKGHTMGVFQLSGDGMTKYLVELKPTRVEDIMAMVALYRPGPIEFIPEYIRRKHNPELIDYPHELLVDILEKSLGLLIYQDDVMLTAIKLAGYSWLDADLFRKAMGKKIPELMLEQEKKF